MGGVADADIRCIELVARVRLRRGPIQFQPVDEADAALVVDTEEGLAGHGAGGQLA